MKKNLSLIFLIIIIILGVNALGTPQEFKDIIDYSVSGEIKADNEFGVKFKENIEVDLEKLDFYNIYPKTDLKISLKQNNILLFKPEKNLIPGRGYTLEIDLRKLFPKNTFKENIFRTRFNVENRKIWLKNKTVTTNNRANALYGLKLRFYSTISLKDMDLTVKDIKIIDHNSKQFFKYPEKIDVEDKYLTVYTGNIKNRDQKNKDLDVFSKDIFLLNNDFYYFFSVPIFERFALHNSYASTSDGSKKIILNFNDEIKPKDLSNLISVSPDVNYVINNNKKNITLTGDFKPGHKYAVNLSRFIESKDGSYLKQDSNLSINIPDLEAKLNFDHKGIYLPLKGQKVVRFKSVNVKK